MGHEVFIGPPARQSWEGLDAQQMSIYSQVTFHLIQIDMLDLGSLKCKVLGKQSVLYHLQ